MPFPFRWIYYYGSNKSTGNEPGKTHLCAGAKSTKNCIPDDVDVHRKLVKVTHYHQDGQCWLVLAQGFWIGVWMNHSHPNVQEGTLILGVLNGDLHRLGTVNHLYMKDKGVIDLEICILVKSFQKCDFIGQITRCVSRY